MLLQRRGLSRNTTLTCQTLIGPEQPLRHDQYMYMKRGFNHCNHLLSCTWLTTLILNYHITSLDALWWFILLVTICQWLYEASFLPLCCCLLPLTSLTCQPWNIPCNYWVCHDRLIWCISVRLSHRSEVTQNKTNFIKNCPQWGLNLQPLDHHSNALPTELSHYLIVCVNKGLYKVMLYWF